MDINKIIIKNIRYNQPKKVNGKYISKGIYMNDEGQSIDIIIKSPYLRIIKLTETYIELGFDVDDQDFYLFFAELDDANIKIAYENSKKWFGDDLPLEVIDEYHKPYVRYGSSIGNPSIRIKLTPELYSILSKITDITSKFMCVNMKYDGLKFLKQQFCAEWSLIDYDIEKQYEFNESVLNDIEQKVIEPQNKVVVNEINKEVIEPQSVKEIIEEIKKEETVKEQEPIKEIQKDKKEIVKEKYKNKHEDTKHKKRIIRLGGNKFKFLD